MVRKINQLLENRDTNMLLSLAVGAIFVIILASGLYPFVGTPAPHSVGVFVPEGSAIYHGKVTLEKEPLLNLTYVVPNLKPGHRNYTYKEVSQIAKGLGMRFPAVFDKGEFYFVSTQNATLIVYKDGRGISYHNSNISSTNMSMSDEQIISLANKYLSNLTLALPYGVRLVPHIEGGILAADSRSVYVAKKVVYNAYFQDYIMSFSVSMVISSSGAIYSFNSTPVIVTFNDYEKIASFAAVYPRIMNHGLPVPVNISSIHKVLIYEVNQGYALVDNNLYPSYILKTRVLYGYDNYVDEEIITYVK